jgi:hypothetical protein
LFCFGSTFLNRERERDRGNRSIIRLKGLETLLGVLSKGSRTQGSIATKFDTFVRKSKGRGPMTMELVYTDTTKKTIKDISHVATVTATVAT